MSRFEVQARAITEILPHPTADKIEFVRIDGYLSIVKKGQVRVGDLAVYLPEAAVLPEFVLRTVGLWNESEGKGRCGGDQGNRVKAVKLRNCLSQGIVYPLSFLPDHALGPSWCLQDEHLEQWPVKEGSDVAAILGITKHIPQIPEGLSGAVLPVGRHLIPDFDIEDIKKHPGVFQEGEEVRISEKLHGIFTGAVLLSESDAIDGNRFFVFGKGLGSEGLAFIDDEANKGNVYLQMAHEAELRAMLEKIASHLNEYSLPVFILGETFGRGVQDLGYASSPSYRAFDIGVGYRGRERYLDYDAAKQLGEDIGVGWVPELYRGPFSASMLTSVITGKESVTGLQVHLREGGVVHPQHERENTSLGRVILKAISPDYILRKGNATEYQ
ncbi:MAG: RNA ligase (ATP) [Agitococcus sp.]|nr:RNA ligase (ATP) [Agitococcus sp.]MDO9179135.1 RNA ligase (ATP) [Agitococcus sp.]